MPSAGTLGSILPSGPKGLKVKHQDFPKDGSTGLQLQPTCLSQITITGLEPRVQDVAGKSKNLVDIGATYSVLTSYSRGFSPQTCTILGFTGKTNYKKINLSTSLLLGWINIFPSVSGGPWVSYSLIGKIYTHWTGTTLVMENFSAPGALQHLVTTEKPITPSPIGRDQKL